MSIIKRKINVFVKGGSATASFTNGAPTTELSLWELRLAIKEMIDAQKAMERAQNDQHKPVWAA